MIEALSWADLWPFLLFTLVIFSFGVWIGKTAEARLWREHGDHEYMHTMESAGKLYLVRLDDD